MTMGRSRMPAACASASTRAAPRTISWRAVASSSTASLTATPAITMSPSIAITPMGRPAGTSTRATPTSARGIAASTVAGCSRDSKVPASTITTSTTARMPASRSSPKVRTRSSSSPRSSARRPGGSGASSRAAATAATASGAAVPSVMSALTRAVRRWSRRRISRAPSASAKRATSSIAMGRPAWLRNTRWGRSSRRGVGRRRVTGRSSSPIASLVTSRPSRLVSSTRASVSRSTPRPSAIARSSSTRSSGGPPSNDERTSHSSSSRERLCLTTSAPRRRSGSDCPEISTTTGGPLVPRAPARADEPSSQSTSVDASASISGARRAASCRPVGPSAAIRTVSRAVFSSVSSLRIMRSSSGSRPTSDSTARRWPPPACPISDSRPAATCAVDSTRCPGGPTTRSENCRGSAGGSSSVPRSSNRHAPSPATTAAASTVARGRRSRPRTRRSRRRR